MRLIHRFSSFATHSSVLGLALIPALAGAAPQPLSGQDPAEPPGGKPASTLLPAPAGVISRASVDEASLRSTIRELVSCGTRSSLSSWTDPQRGIGCARDKIVARFEQIAKSSGSRLQVKVDRFEATAPRTHNEAVPLENVVAILPGNDPTLSKTAFVVSGHFDSMPSNVMDAATDAPGADDDASGSAVSIECARLLAGATFRATLVFATVSGEEQGLLGGTRLLKYLEDNGYTIGGMLDNDIVGADFAAIAPNGAPHRVRLFSKGAADGAESPSRELARAVEEIDGRNAVRLIFRLDRFGRGGDHMPFVEAGLPAVRFTEPLEDYHHEHQTPRVEDGVQYGDLIKFLNFQFMGNVARDNAEALRQLALAPAPPTNVTLSGAVTPDAKVAWSVPDDADRAGFEILRRETTDPRWSVYDFSLAAPAAPAAEGTMLRGVSTDNHYFAVRSVGKNGARSIAVVAEPRRRR